MKRLNLIASAALIFGFAGCASFDKPAKTVSAKLGTFSGERAFEHYYLTVTGQLETSDARGISPSPPPPPPPPPAPAASAPAAPSQETVTVTGSVAADENPSITNTQEAGVDEGDIIKQIGTNLVILQDGRLFSVDLAPNGTPGLRFVDRENIYRDSDEGTWYDEMLVFGRQIIAIGYSYEKDASEFAVFQMEDDGKLTFRDRFFLPSQDYFDGDNYTTRLVDGNLAMHTSFYLSDVESFDAMRAPYLTREHAIADPSPLNAKQIYKPLQDTNDPLLHTITICPLRDLGDSEADVPQCNTTAFIAGDEYEYYASTDAVWLWVNAPENRNRWWRQNADPAAHDGAKPALVYQIPYSGDRPSVAAVMGRPLNQFSLAAGTDVFRALVGIDDGDNGENMHLLELPRSAFARVPSEPDDADYRDVPDSEGRMENRFTNTHLVYTLKNDPFYGPYADDGQQAASSIAVIPFDREVREQTMALPHSTIRLERARDHIVATGYRNNRGLSLSTIDLRGETARVADTETLASRFESENRSHAFNSKVDADGSGIIGIPTVVRVWESGRPVWRSKQSDISFLTLDTEAKLASAGTLVPSGKPTHAAYECEVSCIDWYGNSRPVFTMGRIFALSGTELVEGEMRDARVSRIRSVDLTEPVKSHRTYSVN